MSQNFDELRIDATIADGTPPIRISKDTLAFSLAGGLVGLEVSLPEVTGAYVTLDIPSSHKDAQ